MMRRGWLVMGEQTEGGYIMYQEGNQKEKEKTHEQMDNGISRYKDGMK